MRHASSALRPPRAIAISTLLLVGLGPVRAHADGASTQAAAQALFDEGKRLMAAGALADACPKFAESQRLDPGAGTLLNLGACYERNGQTASAWVTYTDAATTAERTNHADWAKRAKARADALQPKLSKLSIVVPSGAQANGLEIHRDGVVVGSGELGVAIPVDPGPHVIEATAPGKATWTSTVQVGKLHDQVAVTVPALEDAPEAATAAAKAPAPAASPVLATSPAPRDEAAHPGSTQRVIGLAVAGVGVVGLAVGTVFGLKAKSSQSDADPHCVDGGTRCDAVGYQANQDAHSAATVSTIAFIAGGAAIAGGAVIYLTAPKATSSTAAVRVGPNVGGASISVGGSF